MGSIRSTSRSGCTTSVLLAGALVVGAAACAPAGSDPVVLSVVTRPIDPVAGAGWFGWTVRLAGDPHPQHSYRLVVSLDPYAVDTVTGGGVDANAWDSGVVHSGQQDGVRPSGFRYRPDTIYFWSVRVTDEAGHDSGWSARTSWSPPRG